ncbi:pectate lyase C [Colletotrichum truncatum]|uniref:Pectate lyase C n=1 Tax=Colletotrichum truncatum TaxID=5467 RepID=A0ACC3Z2Q6_COLTU|nr:pectate lyase C [Colletotrichum truncatum]KAF6793312.1 pectate lyase C [Colletotrichum truncatum]
MKASAILLAAPALLFQNTVALPCKDPSADCGVAGWTGTKVARQNAVPSAFPGAEGFGKYAVGGRTGQVYKVVNLNDSGAGSLRDAVSQPNRIVVFDVGGVIKISSRIVVSKNIYIAGQTSPSSITVYGNGWSFSNANDAIVRYIRIRMGRGGDSGKDAIGIAEGKNMIFDHVSASWGRDEVFSINGDNAQNISITDSIIAQGLQTHSCGGLIQTDKGVSLFRNAYIDNNTRNAKVKGVNDFQNNVVYNWGVAAYIAGDSAGASYANIQNNYFISGSATSGKPVTRGNANFRGYVKDNFYDANRDGVLDGVPLCVSSTCYSDMAIQTSPFNYPGPAKLLSAADAVKHVIAKAGASITRDSVDIALIKELESYGKSGKLISNESEMGGVGTIAAGTAKKDTDGDGIPDEYESANGLNPNDASDGMKIGAGGYTNLEIYVNSLVPSVY